MKELTTIQARLLALQDEAYRAFHKSLVPTLQQELIGVRVPQVRKLAKELAGTQESEAFLNELPHRFYEENLLHAIWLSAEKDFDRALSGIERFLPYVDNWAVCDGKSPKALLKDTTRFESKALEWLKSDKAYTVRFGVNMLMAFFLDERFREEHLKRVATVDENRFEGADRYYVQMVVAWYFATALAKQWNVALPYIQKKKLSPWIHATTIQKACESYRITAKEKALLRTYK